MFKTLKLGAAGNREKIAHSSSPPAWMAARVEEYSYSTFNFTQTDVVITQWSDNATMPEKLDEFRIKKTSRSWLQRLKNIF